MPLTAIATPSSLSFLSPSPSPSPRTLKLLSPARVSLSPLPTTRSEEEFPPTSLPVFSFSGSKISDVPLLLRTAPADTARAVVHRALVHDLRGKRRGTASTLTRGEVRGGGRKPYQQKGTGRARLGTLRTPLRPGGGVVFGPKPKDWSRKINRKEKRLALSTAIASAAAASDAFVVEDLSSAFEGRPRTRDFVEALKRWGLGPSEKATFLMTELPENVRLSTRNIGTLHMLTPRTLNLFDVLDAKKLVFTPAAVEYLNEVYGPNVEWEDGDEEEEDEGEGDISESSE